MKIKLISYMCHSNHSYEIFDPFIFIIVNNVNVKGSSLADIINRLKGVHQSPIKIEICGCV